MRDSGLLQRAVARLISPLPRSARQCLKRPVRWWLIDDVTRWEVIQAAIDKLKAQRYLEIGVAAGTNFSRIRAPSKWGVDPCEPQGLVRAAVDGKNTFYFQMSSDEFFDRQESMLRCDGIDVAFIDGLHSYTQALKDCERCLAHLRPGGVIFLHDCNPASAARAAPGSSYDEVAAMDLPGWDGEWNGDVWKTVVYLRVARADLRVCVLNCDFGMGVVIPAHAKKLAGYPPARVAAMNYGDLERDRRTLLNLRRPHSLFSVLREALRQRS